MLNSPLGCEFLLSAEDTSLPLETIGAPRVCLRLAAKAVNVVERWSSVHEATVAEVLELGWQKEPLARALLEHPGTHWWFGPPDLERQLWIAHEGVPPDTAQWKRPHNPSGSWERYAQKPIGLQYTSTLFADESASMLMAYDEHSGDHWCDFPLACWLLQFPADVRIFEVHGPQSWHDLCVRYPAIDPDDERLAPNWGAAAEDWDGVHLSFGGLLTCEQARYESPAGWSQHEFWHAEETQWLNSLTTNSHQLPDHAQSHESFSTGSYHIIKAITNSGALLMEADPSEHPEVEPSQPSQVPENQGRLFQSRSGEPKSSGS